MPGPGTCRWTGFARGRAYGRDAHPPWPPTHFSYGGIYLNTHTPVHNPPGNSSSPLPRGIYNLSELPLAFVSGLCVRPAGAYARTAIALHAQNLVTRPPAPYFIYIWVHSPAENPYLGFLADIRPYSRYGAISYHHILHIIAPY